MKSGDKARVKVLNDVIVLVQKEQTKGKSKVEVTEQMVTDCLVKEQKLLEEMVATCPDTATYADRRADYLEQLAVIKEYAPQMITDIEAIQFMIVEIIDGEFAMIPANKGLAMKKVMPALKTKNCDMKIAQQVLQSMFK
jgi:hypothetical protein